MILVKTKETLKRLRNKYCENIRDAVRDIKPHYGNPTSRGGYGYVGIEDTDRDFIYHAISGLCVSVEEVNGPIAFDIENNYITETRAMKDLDNLKNLIHRDIIHIKQIKEKYKNEKKQDLYPIEVCLVYHKEIYEILEEIYNFDELIEFKEKEAQKLETKKINNQKMDSEKVIKDEANEFHESSIHPQNNIEKQVASLKKKLESFYTPNNKVIFLTQLQENIITDLNEHRQKNHQGLSKPDCSYEKVSEKILFYVNQEIDQLPSITHQKTVPNPNKDRTKVFVSYCHTDKAHLDDIKRYFKPFLNKIDFWDDSKIKAGQKWKEEITNIIKQTKVAIFLVSTDFLGSDFIAKEEIPPLLIAAQEEGAEILMIILEPCTFDDFPRLNQYQAMNGPNNSILKMTELSKKEFYVQLVKRTAEILEVKLNE